MPDPLTDGDAGSAPLDDGVRGPFPTDLAPFDGSPFRVRVGLRPLDPSRWLEIDDAYDEQLALKRRLYRDRYDDVVVAVEHPLVVEAATELYEEVGRSLTVAGAGRVEPPDAWGHPIAAVGLSTQEDWCLMCRLDAGPGAGHDGGLVLGCASVCFPTRWDLRRKLGRSVGAIHAPVPLYAEQAGGAVDRLLDRLSVERPVWRVNWNLCDDSALHQPYVGRRDAPGAIDVDDVGELVWLRLERQTLRRLPVTGAIAFGIRVHHQPLSETAASPDLVRRLRAAVSQLPEEVADYKGIGHLADAIDQWCEQVTGA